MEWEKRWRRLQSKVSTNKFDPKLCKEGYKIKVFLLADHSSQCPTVPTSKNNPEIKKKIILDKAQAYKEAKARIITYLEEHPEKTSNDIIKWMQSNMEIYLHLQNIQVQNIVYRHRKEWMVTQEAYARAHQFNSENLPFLRANLILNIKKGNKDVGYNI